MATLLFDGDCAFCTRSATWIEHRVPDDVDVTPWQSVDLDAVGLTVQQVTTAAYFLTDDRPPQRGHRAIGHVLVACGGPWRVVGAVCLVPPTSWLAAVAYRLVARYRHQLPGGTAACRLDGGFTPANSTKGEP